MTLPILTQGSNCCQITCYDEDCNVSDLVEWALQATNCICNVYVLDLLGNDSSECKSHHPMQKPEFKSQTKAFSLSYFLGWLGADMFYLANGEEEWNKDYLQYALFKLFTAGGGPILYIRDLIRFDNNEYADGRGYALVQDFTWKYGESGRAFECLVKPNAALLTRYFIINY